jgi:hypothetical protein
MGWCGVTILYCINAEHGVWSYVKRVGGSQSRTTAMEQRHGGTKGAPTEPMPIDEPQYCVKDARMRDNRASLESSLARNVRREKVGEKVRRRAGETTCRGRDRAKPLWHGVSLPTVTPKGVMMRWCFDKWGVERWPYTSRGVEEPIRRFDEQVRTGRLRGGPLAKKRKEDERVPGDCAAK